MIGKSAALITPRSRPVFRTMKENSPSYTMLRPIPSTNGLACQKPKEPDAAVHRAQLAKKMVASVITATGTQYVAISERSISAPMVTKISPRKDLPCRRDHVDIISENLFPAITTPARQAPVAAEKLSWCDERNARPNAVLRAKK
jgi:hypothetical protein